MDDSGDKNGGHLLAVNRWKRRYPWGIQRLVSTHQLPHKSGGGLLWTNSNPKSLNLDKFSFSGGGGVLWANSNPNQLNSTQVYIWGVEMGKGRGVLWTKSNLKSQHLWEFAFPRGWGGGTLDGTFLKCLSGGTFGILNQKFSQPSLPLHDK